MAKVWFKLRLSYPKARLRLLSPFENLFECDGVTGGKVIANQKPQGSNDEVRATRYEIRATSEEIRNTKYESRNWNFELILDREKLMANG